MQAKPKGVMEYGQKAGGVLVVCQTEAIAT
jgi:hypothetical protein